MRESRSTGQPRLHPRHPPLRRAADTVQLGLGSAAVMLAGLTPGQIAVLDRLDGSRSLAALDEVAAAHGDPPERVRELIDELTDRRLLVDVGAERAHRLTEWRRTRHTVAVSAPSPLRESLVEALTRAETGEVRSLGWPTTDARPAGARPPDLVVLGAYDGFHPTAGQEWLASGVAHLAVLAEAEGVTVGPLVDTMTEPDAPCLRCLELHRCDRDEARVALLAQSARPSASLSASRPSQFRHRPDTLTALTALTALTGPGGPARPLPLEPALLAASAAIVALVAAAYLCGDVLPAGVTVELTAPWPRLDHRRWARHPLCHAHASEVLPRSPAERVSTMAPTGRQ